MPRRRIRQAYTVEIEVLNDEGNFVQYLPPQVPNAAEDRDDGSADADAMVWEHSTETITEEFQLSLSRHFASSNDCVLLRTSQDGREAHFLTPQYDLGTCSIHPLQYGFLGLRWVKVAGGEHLVSFCKNPSCSTAADDGSLYEGADFAASPVEILFAGQSTLCICADALIEAIGGENALRAEIDSAQLQDSDAAINFSSGGHTFQIVQAGSHFRDWGILKGRKCQTCEGQQSRCPHLQKLRGEDPASIDTAEWLPTAVFEEKLDKVQCCLVDVAMLQTYGLH